MRHALVNVISKHYQRHGEKNISKGIADVVWSNNVFNGVVPDELFKRSKVVIRGIFSGDKILREMDLSSGSLNFAAIEVLRKVEGLSKHQEGIIPSS